MRFLPAAAIAALALAGCNDTGAPAPQPSPGEAPEVLPALPLPTAVSTSLSAIDPAAPQAIPAALRGRWGLVPDDCTSTRGDAKGLLTIGPDTLTFYESRAKLGQIEEIDDSRIRASFDFSGEGMIWTRDAVLGLKDGGKTLVRREYGEDATPGPLRYTRCP
jgi:hypothetical protein